MMEYYKMSILWRASTMAAMPNNAEYYKEQQKLLNNALGLYLDELMPERRIDRDEAVMSSADKMKMFVKNKDPYKLFMGDPPNQLPQRGQSIQLGKHYG